VADGCRGRRHEHEEKGLYKLGAGETEFKKPIPAEPWKKTDLTMQTRIIRVLRGTNYAATMLLFGENTNIGGGENILGRKKVLGDQKPQKEVQLRSRMRQGEKGQTGTWNSQQQPVVKSSERKIEPVKGIKIGGRGSEGTLGGKTPWRLDLFQIRGCLCHTIFGRTNKPKQ